MATEMATEMATGLGFKSKVRIWVALRFKSLKQFGRWCWNFGFAGFIPGYLSPGYAYSVGNRLLRGF